MSSSKNNAASPALVILAFAIVYIVWGSTYFFIEKAVHAIPPFLIGALRFFSAAVLMLGWCLYNKEQIFEAKQVKHAVVSGLLLLLVGNGSVIWVEQYLPSALVAITISSAPLWFVLLDKPLWGVNLRNKLTVSGLLIGFVGVVLLFYKNLSGSVSGTGGLEMKGMAIVVLGSMGWSAGSLYSKYNNSTGSTTVASAWQMFTAGVAFLLISLFRGEPAGFNWSAVSLSAWLSVVYLSLFGSIAAFSAYVWLLKVRPATQVSTYAYVNPVVAVLLGVFFNHESISFLQIVGLAVILGSVLLINVAKYRQSKLSVAVQEERG